MKLTAYQVGIIVPIVILMLGLMNLPECFAGITEKQPNARFVDNGNGTVTDKKSNLIVLKNANCFGEKSWNDAMQAASTLASGACGLSDGSGMGDWRLPTKDELPFLMEWNESGAFINVQPYNYWSSTTLDKKIIFAWFVNLNFNNIDSINESFSYFVWPVRGGP